MAGFNSRSRVGSDVNAIMEGPAFDVSIHAPAWGATSLHRFAFLFVTVSIHAPAWGATQVRAAWRVPEAFQFTLPRGERHIFAIVGVKILCFNSRSRVGSDKSKCLVLPKISVSIHAPAWGATYGAGTFRQSPAFQFTLPRGERPWQV